MTAAAAATPLLATKLHLPVARATAVMRSRLIARLLNGLRTRLTLLAAPAGFGKSTLLAQALAAARPEGQEIAWVSLDEGDNYPTRFWSYACSALERASPGLGTPALAVLRAAPTTVEPALAELLNALAAHAADVVLMLDDYHAITNPAIHEQISFLLDHAPPQFHFLIASRIDPPLPLARWRARGELAELRAADLRFTTDEALQFFAETMGLRLDAEIVAALEARTEGWAAGLQLAALSLQGQADVRSFIASFSGSHRHVADYLVEEVLDRQPGHIRAFLLQTSILERMSAELCDALIEHEKHSDSSGLAAATILVDLDRQNLFLIPLDEERHWYRYHHLFAELLRHRLKQEQPAVVPELHRRAALWFERQGAAADAVRHALKATDSELVIRLLTLHAARFAANGETQTLQHWLDALPREQLMRSPQLCLAQARVLLLSREMAASEPYLQAAAAALTSVDEPEALGLQGELLTLRAHVEIERGAYGEALSLARQALMLLPETEHWARSSSGLALGYALMVLGYTAEALAAHAENVRRSRTAGNAVSALFSATEVVKLQVLQGRLAEARTSAEQALAWVEAEGWQQLPPTSALHIWRGNVLIEQGDFPAAEAALARAIQLTRHGPGITAARAHTFMARLRQIAGDQAGATAAIATVEAIVSGWEPSGERSFFAAYIARLRLLGGDSAAARRWASERRPWQPDEPHSYFREIELLTLARVTILTEATPIDHARLEETLAMLTWLREHALAAGRGTVVIEALALAALAHARCGAREQAHELLDTALTQAAPQGFVGIFVDLGAPLADLVAQSAKRTAQSDSIQAYMQRLLAAFRHTNSADPTLEQAGQPALRPALERSSALQEALTEREVEVLRLFAAGMTSPEIAQHFVVSINTVKTQLKSIYSKLDSHSRAEAVARARELGLIP
jgi:LuxR family maltose regulon positive regulatory protein